MYATRFKLVVIYPAFFKFGKYLVIGRGLPDWPIRFESKEEASKICDFVRKFKKYVISINHRNLLVGRKHKFYSQNLLISCPHRKSVPSLRFSVIKN